MRPGSLQVSLGGGMPELGAKSTAQLKCIDTNTQNMYSKQEELEAIVQQERYYVVAITEMWWDDMTGVLQWMPPSFSEGTGEGGEVVGWLCILGSVLTL